jgi:aspartate aminotransferase-like enzyme
MTTQVPFGRFFLPGPTEVRPDVMAAMTRPMIPHRGADFETLFARLQAGLHAVFRTRRPVYISSSSATGLMEGSIRGAPAGRILSVVNGAFSERYAQVARSCGREVDVLQIEWGQVVDADRLEASLQSGKYAAVTVVHSETSTGALTDVRHLAPVCSRHGAMILVDSVSGVGGVQLLPDEWGLDFVFTGSQKALALPPGLAFAVASERYMEAAAKQENRGTYFDVVEFDRYAAKRQTPNTPALSLFYALDAQLERIVTEGVEERWARHLAMSVRTVRWTTELAEDGLELGMLPPEGARSPTVSCIRLPEGVTGEIVAGSVEDLGFTIAPGYGPLKASTIRVGHMGDHTLPELENCLAAVRKVLVDGRA